MSVFAVDLRLRGRRALVVGGGRIAARRVEALRHAGAEVTVVAPRLGEALATRLPTGDFAWKARPFRAGDCAGHHVVVSCADDPAVGPAVAADAHAHGVLCNVADVPELCDFYFGAVARQGPLTVSVHTGGQAPGMASRVRDELRLWLDAAAAERTVSFARLRSAVHALDAAPAHAAARAAFLARYRDDDAALLALAAPGGVEAALARYSRPAAAVAADERRGAVYLVGAGPGDPELLTLKAARLLREADDLVVDALVPPAVYAGSRARVFYVGKRRGGGTAQDDIGALLVRLGAAGRTVVRLKGGDPGLFGRAAEELAAVAAAGIHCELVPGVSSALAVAAGIGAPLTARGVADRVVIATASSHAGGLPPAPPAYRPDQTVVLLMALGHLEALVAQLLAAGYPAELPAALVSRYGWDDERAAITTLANLPGAAEALPTPATLVLGWVLEVGQAAGVRPAAAER